VPPGNPEKPSADLRVESAKARFTESVTIAIDQMAEVRRAVRRELRADS
jgi:hypothetical protein